MKMEDLIERRGRIVADMRSITEAPTGDGGDLSTEQAAKFEAMKAELRTLEKSIDRQRLVDESERRMNCEHIAGSGDTRLDAELRMFSLTRAILSQCPGHGVDCSRERELSAEVARRSGRQFQGIAIPLSIFHKPIERRTLVSDVNTSSGSGGALIGVDTMGNQFIDKLRSALVVRQLGATVLSDLSSNVDIPRLTTGATSGWIAENSAITPSDEEFDSVQLRPKHCGTMTEFSRNMLLQSSPDVETLIRNDLAAGLARAIDSAALVGGGSNEPTGIVSNSDVNGDTDFSTPSWVAVLELIETVETADAAGTAFVTNAAVVRTLRSTARLDGTDSQMVMEAPRMLAGFPLAQTSLCPASTIIYGDFGSLLLGIWGSGVDLLVNPYATESYSKGNVLVRGLITADVALRHPESFAFSSNVATTA